MTATVCLCAQLSGQVVSLEAGDRIRVVPLSPLAGEVVGSYAGQDERELLLYTSRSIKPEMIALSDIGLLQKSIGRDPAIAWGSVGLGAAVGALVGSAVSDRPERCDSELVDDDECRRETSDPVIGAVVGGIVFGILSRATVARERWVDVSLAHLMASVRPDRLELGLRLQF